MKAKRIQKVGMFLFFGFLFISWLPSEAESYPINWSPKKIQQVIQAGDTLSTTASFISSERLENVDVWVVPELQPFVSISPNSFAIIEPNISYSIDLQISIPVSTVIGLFDGTIHLKSGTNTYPQTFKVILNIGFDEMALDFSESRTLPYLSNDMVLFENVKYESDRYAIIMKWDNFEFQPIEMKKMDTVEIPLHAITIDGNSADWAGILPAVEDPLGDKDSAYNVSPGTDLANLYLARDQEYIYFLMTLHDGDPQQNDLYEVEFRQYLNQIHTPGDRFIQAYFEGNSWIVRITDRTWLGDPSLFFLDSVGVGTGMLEWKIPIEVVEWRSPNPGELIPQPYFPPSPQGIQGVENRLIRTYIHPFGGPVSDGNENSAEPMIINFYQ